MARSLRKAEVDLDLEGCLPLDLLAAVARRQGASVLDRSQGFAALRVPCEPRSNLRPARRARELTTWPIGWRSASRKRVPLCQRIVNPTHWPGWSVLERFLVALDEGFSAAEADGLPAVGLCPSIERRQSREEAIALVDELSRSPIPAFAGSRLTETSRSRVAPPSASHRPSPARARQGSDVRRMRESRVAPRAYATRSRFCRSIASTTAFVHGRTRRSSPISPAAEPRSGSAPPPISRSGCTRICASIRSTGCGVPACGSR